MADRYEDQYRRDRERGYRRDDRGFIDRAGDEVRAWFGDDEAERRRQLDDRDRGYAREREGYAGYGERPSGGERSSGYGDRSHGQGYGLHGGAYSPASPYGYGERGGERAFGEGGDRGYATARPSMDRSYDRSEHGSDRWPGAAYDTRPRYGPGSSMADRDDPGQTTGWFGGRGPKGYQRSDARINEDVCDRLCDSGEVDATDVEVRVSDGEVTLSGSVSDRNQKRRAEDLIEKVSGVREVHNNLRVGSADAQASGLRSSAASGASSASGAASPGGVTARAGNAEPEQPGNVLGVTGAPDKTITAGRR